MRMSEEIVLPLQEREMRRYLPRATVPARRRSHFWHKTSPRPALARLCRSCSAGEMSSVPGRRECGRRQWRGSGIPWSRANRVKPREVGNDRGRARDEEGSGWFQKIALGVDVDKDLRAFEHEPDSRADNQWMHPRLGHCKRPSRVVPLCNGLSRTAKSHEVIDGCSESARCVIILS